MVKRYFISMKKDLRIRSDRSIPLTIKGQKFSNKKIKGIYLECYEELALVQLKKIRSKALNNWKLNECLIIHRIGKLDLGEKIVLVITASSHRANAIKACEFVIDSLKIDVAFWKFHLLDNDQKEMVLQKSLDNEKMLKWREIIN